MKKDTLLQLCKIKTRLFRLSSQALHLIEAIEPLIKEVGDPELGKISGLVDASESAAQMAADDMETFLNNIKGAGNNGNGR